MSVTAKGTAIPTGGGGDGLFVRQSSGLVREVGVRDSMGMGLSVLLLIGIFTVTSVFLAAFPNGDFYVPVLVGAGVSILLAFAYAQLVTTFPRGGGEYLYASRTFSPVVGAFVGGLVFLGLVVTGSTNIIQTCQIQVPFMFSALGHAFHSHALETFASGTMQKKGAWIVTGIVIVGLCAAICMRPIHTVAKWIFWTFVAGFGTTLLIALILLFESRTGFINAFNAESGHGAYQAIIAKAHAEGFQTGIKWRDVVALLPVGALMFLGFTFGNYAAGEIKRPARTYKIAVFGAIAVGSLGLLLGWAGMRHAAGIDFMQSSASLAGTNPEAYEALTPVQQSQGGLSYALLAAGDPVTSIIIGVGTFVAWLSMAVAFFMMCTRVIFALSFDRLLPTKLAEVQPKTHAPVYAVCLVGIVTLAFVVVGNATTLLTLFRNFLIISNAILIVGSICAAAVPFRRPELFAASPAVIRGRIFGIPWISIVASLSALAFTGLLVDVAVREQYSGGYSTSSIITLVVVATCGGVFYAISRWNMARRGIDLRLAMRELPPE
jgi:APA family basic amino acid/polyamine antiporter